MLVVSLALMLAAMPSDAFAYIDPGSGALMWQALLSAFFGALFVARRGVWRVLRALGAKRENLAPPADSSAEPPGPNA